MRVAELCAGYGGLFEALRLAGLPVELAWVAENDPDASRVLDFHHPGVKNVGDMTTADFSAQEPADILAAGFPCQDVSVAGLGAGMRPGTRSGLWFHVARAIRELRPPLVFLENVRGLLSADAHSNVEPCPWCVGDPPGERVLRALGAVLGDLADLGFDAEWVCVPASDVGAPHERYRVFVLAWPTPDASGNGYGDGRSAAGRGLPSAAVGGTAADPNGSGWGPAVNGLPAREPDIARCGDAGLSLLPTPVARDTGRSPEAHLAMRTADGHNSVTSLSVAVQLLSTPAARAGGDRGSPSMETAQRRMWEEGRRNLEDAVALLPTPSARDSGRGAGWGDEPGRPLSETIMRFLPTPTASERTGAGDDGRDGGPNLRTVVSLLPTPAATDANGARNATASRRDPKPTTATTGWTLSDVAYVDRWGDYGPAIRRWERVIGRAAPDPTEPGRRGQPRLSARFVEWMQGLPEGYVTGHVDRNAALRILGNGVVPLQGAYAVRLLAPALPALGEVAA